MALLVNIESVLTLGDSVLRQTTLDKKRKDELDELALLGRRAIEFVYGYTDSSQNPDYDDDPTLDSDDEVVNWTMVDVAGDLSSSVWLLVSGFYKAAGSSMRNALDLAFAALYFQAEVFDDHSKGCYELEFGKWDRGEADTPSWKTTTPFLKGRKTVKGFNAAHGCDVLEEVRNQFRKLCGYTHSRAWEKKSGDPSNIMWMGESPPAFEEELFWKFCNVYRDTVSAIALAWLVSFPHIFKKRPLGLNKEPYLHLLSGMRGAEAVEYYW